MDKSLLIVVLLLAVGGLFAGGIVSFSTIGKTTNLEIPCNNINECEALYEAEGFSESDIDKVSIFCEENKCYIPVYSEIVVRE